MSIVWKHLLEERQESREGRMVNIFFENLKPGEYFIWFGIGQYFTLRQVVMHGVYKMSEVVGRNAQDLVVIEIPEAPRTQEHVGSRVKVYRVKLNLEPLRQELMAFTAIEEMNRKFESYGGVAAPDDFYDVFREEYDRRGWSLPQ